MNLPAVRRGGQGIITLNYWATEQGSISTGVLAMTEKKRIITRRDFIRTGSRVVMGSLMGFPWCARPPATLRKRAAWS